MKSEKTYDVRIYRYGGQFAPIVEGRTIPIHEKYLSDASEYIGCYRSLDEDQLYSIMTIIAERPYDAEDFLDKVLKPRQAWTLKKAISLISVIFSTKHH